MHAFGDKSGGNKVSRIMFVNENSLLKMFSEI